MRSVILMFLVIALCFSVLVYKSNNPEDLINYGNDNYNFVSVNVDYGKHGMSYYGTISKADYNKWLNGELGTVFIYSTKFENRGWRVNVSSIISMSNYGCAPDHLPTNFRTS